MKRVAVASAGTILLLMGVLTAAAQEVEQRCKDNVTVATGAATYFGEGRAKRLAITAWQREVRAKYGERYMDFAKARVVGSGFECQAAAVGSVVGKFSRRCIVRATPCRFAEVADDDSVGENEGDRKVFRIQRLLARAGYLSSDAVDGEYGGETRRAVRRFQVDEDLRATGEVDDRTLERLRRRAE